MSESKPATLPSITTAHVVLILGGGVLVVGLVIGLIVTTGAEGRSEAFAWLSSLFALVASGVSGVGVLQTRSARHGIEQVRKQTNGVLDQRIRDGVAEVLQDHGLSPARRQDDPPAELPTPRAGV